MKNWMSVCVLSLVMVGVGGDIVRGQEVPNLPPEIFSYNVEYLGLNQAGHHRWRIWGSVCDEDPANCRVLFVGINGLALVGGPNGAPTTMPCDQHGGFDGFIVTPNPGQGQVSARARNFNDGKISGPVIIDLVFPAQEPPMP